MYIIPYNVVLCITPENVFFWTNLKMEGESYFQLYTEFGKGWNKVPELSTYRENYLCSLFLLSRIFRTLLKFFFLFYFVSFQLVKDFDVIHTPNQVGDSIHLSYLWIKINVVAAFQRVNISGSQDAI